MKQPCPWCGKPLGDDATVDQLYCSKRCRQTAWRARRVSLMEGADTRKRIGYGDPPYPGTARKYYRDEPNYAGEVDHAALVAELVTFDGWALSTSARSLREVLPLCPAEARVASWVKPHGVSRKTRGPHNAWEPVIYVPARLAQPGRRDWLRAMPARGGGLTLPGRKPLAFYRWLFELLGMAPGDEFVEKFPGTETGSRAWRQVSRRYPSDGPSPEYSGDASIDAASLTLRLPSAVT